VQASQGQMWVMKDSLRRMSKGSKGGMRLSLQDLLEVAEDSIGVSDF
jgi:hypothetical protein